MAHKKHYGMSELEQEFELEMDNPNGLGMDHELESEFEAMLESNEEEYEYDEDSLESEYEYDGVEGSEYENEIEDSEYEFEEDFEPETYGERLYEISQREFESDGQMDEALGEVLDDMEREYFFKGLSRLVKKGIKGGVSFLNKNPIAKQLISKAVNAAAGFIPGGRVALDAINTFGKPLLQGIRNNWTGAVKAGASAIAPDAVRIAGNFANKLGLRPNNSEENNRDAFQQIAEGIQRSYEFAAENFGDHVGDPLVASRLANRAFEAGLQKIMQPKQESSFGRRSLGKGKKGVRTIRLQERPGEEIEKIVIVIDRKP